MGWSDALGKIPEVFYKVTKLAVDLQNVQKDVEELQKQNRTLAETCVRQEEQIKQLKEKADKASALSEKVGKLENELSLLKSLNEANNNAHLQTITIAKYDLEKHINVALGNQAIEFKNELAAFARNHAQHTSSAQALITSDDNDGRKTP